MIPTAASAAPIARRSSAHPSWFILGVGLGFLALFLVGFMTQIGTNEAFITNAGQVNIFKPNWMILLQIPNLVMGNASPSDAMATVFGWGIELIYLGFIVGYELMHNAVDQTGQFMGGLFRTASWGIVLFNGWTDYNYGTLGSGIGGHLAFALMQSFIVGFFATVGLFFIRFAWNQA
jgi:hypothetical protein